MRLTSRIETGAQLWRCYRAQIVAFAKEAIADPRNEIVRDIAQRTRNRSKQPGPKSPASTQAPRNVNERIGAHKQRAFVREYNDAIGQASAMFGGNP